MNNRVVPGFSLLLVVLMIVAVGPLQGSALDARKGTGIPKRSRQANRDMIDLAAYYTSSLDRDWLGKPGANLAQLPKGVQAFARAAFDVRGLIQLAGKNTLAATGREFPRSVDGIAVNRKGRRLHLLHGAVWSAKDDAVIGEYVLHFANGETRSLPITYQRNVRNWWVKKGDPALTDADPAWTGETEAAHGKGFQVQLYRYTANNPLPNEEIQTIDFVSAMTESAPFLIALTVEPLEPTYLGLKAVSIDNPIVARSREAGPDLVDLSKFYDASLDDDWFQHYGHDLQDVPRGVQMLGGVPFDVRGLIQLAGTKSMDVAGVVFPETVEGIPVNRKGRRLHFLQACGWSAEVGAKLGDYVIHYADGQIRRAPILYGRNVMDWWARPGEGSPSEAQEVWRGSNAATRAEGFSTHLIKYTWDNPVPNVEITTIDFVSDVIAAAPNLVAITVEPNAAR
jgi:hypothetical protein